MTRETAERPIFVTAPGKQRKADRPWIQRIRDWFRRRNTGRANDISTEDRFGSPKNEAMLRELEELFEKNGREFAELEAPILAALRDCGVTVTTIGRAPGDLPVAMPDVDLQATARNVDDPCELECRAVRRIGVDVRDFGKQRFRVGCCEIAFCRKTCVGRPRSLLTSNCQAEQCSNSKARRLECSMTHLDLLTDSMTLRVEASFIATET